MIYLNHAASSYPKPRAVIEAVSACMSALPGDGRSSAAVGGDVTGACRSELARLFNASSPERIFFTGGATQALNLIIRGLPLGKGRVLALSTSHNAVLRPLYALLPQERIDIVHADKDGFVSPESVEKALTDDTVCVFLDHCSNVTGAVQDVAAIGRLAKSRGAWLVVDGSQSAGALPVDVTGTGTDIFVFTGHKALLGPTGTGGFYLAEGVPLRPVCFGGTGTEGDSVLPKAAELFEVGTQNTHGIAGLVAGVRLISEGDLSASSRAVEGKITALRNRLETLPKVRVYGGKPPCGGVLSFNIEGLTPGDVGYALYHAYEIIVRTGHHCAPLIGGDIGAPSGSVRVSISPKTTDGELEALLAAVTDLAQGAAGEGL